ncbi:MAG: HD domain-containing protein [Deltaproteobacteria bacterium]|nr:HD domain-containing protein [Deltaproteobacteria bacterium]
MPEGKEDEALKFAVKTQHDLDPDPAHSTQVSILALNLFDRLKAAHRLGKKEKRLLELAAILHDTGWSNKDAALGGHHKASASIIRSLDIPGLREDDRILCSLIARYHTKALPDKERHKKFAKLSKKDRNRVEWLAAILRVADAFDCRHLGNVKGFKCAVGGAVAVISVKASGSDYGAEVGKAVLKHALLVKKLGKAIEYR